MPSSRPGSEEAETRKRDLEPVFPAEMLSILVHHLPGMAYECEPDPPWRLRFVSEGIEPLTGRPAASFLCHDIVWANIVHPAELARVKREVADAVRARRSYSLRYRILHSSGEERWIWERGEPVVRPEAGLVLVGFNFDISEQVLAERQLRESADRYALAVRATSDAIWDWSLADGTISWSGAVQKTLGYDIEAIGGTFDWWKEAIHPGDRERVLASLDRMIAGSGFNWTGEYRFRRGDGSYVWLRDRGLAIREANGTAIRMVGAIEDISESKAAAETVQRLQAELAHITRLSAMGVMASTIAHELNQPLTAASNWIAGGQTQLARMAGAPESIGEALDQAKGAIIRAGDILRSLRMMIAKGSAPTRTVNIATIVREAADTALLGARQDGVRYRTDAEEAMVAADPVQIEQVLINLIRNACEAMEAQDVKQLRIGAARRDRLVEISVADNGPGLDPSVRESLFTPFQSTKASGLGVGLSICRTIVEAHNGTIWAEDNPGGGTIFRFTLPAALEE